MGRRHGVFSQWLAWALMVSMLTPFLQIRAAQAALIGTEEVLAAAAADAQRERLQGLLQRDDVKRQLERLGIDPAAARARVEGLTDAEVATIAGRLEQLPAGGESLLGALVFIFVLLLITDILGFTKVFPFTRSVR